MTATAMVWRIRNVFSGLFVPGVWFEWKPDAEAWIFRQLRPQDFEPEASFDVVIERQGAA